MYGGGHAEELVGKAIKDFKRDDIFIITKSLAKPHKV
jgi:aryl-alcohol dehydrogenase-like predicted oxidoreductase